MVALDSVLMHTAVSTGLAPGDNSPSHKRVRRRFARELVVFREGSGRRGLDPDFDTESESDLNSSQSCIFSVSSRSTIQYSQESSVRSDNQPTKPETSRHLPGNDQRSEENITTTNSSELLSQPPNNAAPPTTTPPHDRTHDDGNDSSTHSTKPVHSPPCPSSSTSNRLASRLSKFLPLAGRRIERKDIPTVDQSSTEPKDDTVIVPISDRNKVYRFPRVADLYVGLEDQIVPSAKHLDLWRRYVEPRLWTDISAFQQKLKQTKLGRRLPPPSISLELRMSGYAAVGSGMVELLPCIWILYNEKQWKKEFKKFVQESEWLHHEDFGNVEVQRGSPRLSTLSSSVYIHGLDLKPEQSFDVSGGLHLYLHVEVSDSDSANGLICCATVTDPKNEIILGQRISRIGGLISVNGRNMATTTAHGMLELCWDLVASIEPPETENEDSAGEDDEDASSGASAGLEVTEDWDDDSDGGSEYTQESDSWTNIVGKVDYASSTSWQTVQVHGMTSFLGKYGLDPGSIHPPRTLELTSGDLQSAISATETKIQFEVESDNPEIPIVSDPFASDIDFSLWYLPDNGRLKNEFRAPGVENTIYVNERSSPDIDDCTKVLIILRPGEILEGCCIPGHSYFAVNGVKFRTRKIRLDAPIALGCSGSWVLVGDKFCGVIIACYQHEPYAHMVTCHQLFDHTRDLIIGASHIKLPQAEKPVSWLNVGTSKSSSESGALSNSLLLNSMGSEAEKQPAYDSDYEEMKKLDRAIESFLVKKSDISNKLKTILLKTQHLQAQQRLFPLHMTQAKREEATVMLREVCRGMENIPEVFEFWYSLTEDKMRAAAIVKTYLQLRSIDNDINNITGSARQHCQMIMTCEELNSAAALINSILEDLNIHFPSCLRLKPSNELGLLREQGPAWDVASHIRHKQGAARDSGSKDTPGQNPDAKLTFDKLWEQLYKTWHVINVSQTRYYAQTVDIAGAESDFDETQSTKSYQESRRKRQSVVIHQGVFGFRDNDKYHFFSLSL